MSALALIAEGNENIVVRALPGQGIVNELLQGIRDNGMTASEIPANHIDASDFFSLAAPGKPTTPSRMIDNDSEVLVFTDIDSAPKDVFDMIAGLVVTRTVGSIALYEPKIVILVTSRPTDRINAMLAGEFAVATSEV